MSLQPGLGEPDVLFQASLKAMQHVNWPTCLPSNKREAFRVNPEGVRNEVQTQIFNSGASTFKFRRPQ